MYDVWFARNSGGFLYYCLALPGDAPTGRVQPVKNVAQAYKRLRTRGIKIVQVGIADAEMLGLT